jgi:hypothetical protein
MTGNNGGPRADKSRADKMIADDVKAFIVHALACFDTPSQVAEAVRLEFGIETTRQNVEKYDPTKVSGKALALKWRTLFHAMRASFVNDTTQIAIAHRSTRLRALQRMAAKAEDAGKLTLAASLHKQAAEEMGNAYTNRREFTGKDGKDLPPPPPIAGVAIFALPDNGRDK